MWDQNILVENSPDKLRDTVLFLIGINCGLRAGDEHYDLRRDTIDRKSQFEFKHNDSAVRCLVYTEDIVTKMHDRGLNSMRKERKIIWVNPSQDVNKCPVRLVDKYISLCLPIGKSGNVSFTCEVLKRPTLLSGITIEL